MMKSDIDLRRRSFLKIVTAAGSSFFFTSKLFGQVYTFLEPYDTENPLAYYPNRGWEKFFRDLWNYDYKFVFLCAPNDTHNCLLEAYVKNNTVVRIAPTMKYHLAQDIYGDKPSQRWEPRCCQKGLALVRRIYGDRRVKYPVVREGFLKWVNDGFPREKDGKPPKKYFEGRGKETFIRISWDEAFQITAKVLHNIAQAYSGQEGVEKLKLQGYDPIMAEATQGIGTQVLKFRGGMPALGVTRIFGMYRLANSMALLDAHIRDTPPEKSKGGRGWDNYSWHTDLPPGHPMVTGQQTVDFDLVCADHANYIVVWGMNWITTKMPDSHWLTEARLKGATVTVIACEYSATCSKADKVLIVRPGTTPALALGFSHVIIKEKLYDEEYLKMYTDFPLLVRMDNLKLLKASEIIPNYSHAELKSVKVIKEGEKVPPPALQNKPIITESRRKEWDDFVVWDEQKDQPVVITRDDYGKAVKEKGIKPKLEGEFKVKLKDGQEINVRTVFSIIKEYILENYPPSVVEEITWAPAKGVIEVARDIAKNAGKTLFAVGMGPNQFFNNDLKDRAIFILAALTKNIGLVGANVGSFAGNYRGALFNGLPTYISEDPFAPQTDEKGQVKVKPYFVPESVHYFNEGDKILRVGSKVYTGKSHIPTPTKSILVSNSNSLIGNAKWHFDTVMNVFPKVEFIGVLEWWWTASCEYADIVFPVDSWAEFKVPDATISVTNPFLYVFPRTPLPRIFNTKPDLEVIAGIAKALGDITGDKRFYDYFKFVHEGKSEVYLQRIFDNSETTKGYNFIELEKNAQEGIPALLMTRTYPKFVGYDQMVEQMPWYTKTGRIEFYREEDEFITVGENIPVYREPIDSTFYEPNVIVSKKHGFLSPEPPEKIGISPDDLSTDVRQGRNVIKSWSEVKKTQHPLTKKGFKFIFHTPKYRHGAHTTPVDTDVCAIWFGPFGDIYRRDKRIPFVTELYVDINPLDAKELGIEDGDYVWIDADPSDRPFRNWQNYKDTDKYELARLLVRARYYPGTPRGVLRMWHNAYTATFGSVKGSKENKTGLAKNTSTGYQALFRRGSHQSCTRSWLKPTWMTDSLTRKEMFGQVIGKGFAPDIHCPTGAPRESLVKLELAEKGGRDGKGPWFPVKLGIRPTYESEYFKMYLEGKLISGKEG